MRYRILLQFNQTTVDDLKIKYMRAVMGIGHHPSPAPKTHSTVFFYLTGWNPI